MLSETGSPQVVVGLRYVDTNECPKLSLHDTCLPALGTDRVLMQGRSDTANVFRRHRSVALPRGEGWMIGQKEKG